MRALLLLLATTVAFAATNSAFDRGKALLDQHDPAGALVEFKRAVDADPNNAQNLLYCAIASYRAGDLDAAEKYGRDALARASGAETKQISDVVALITKRRARTEHMREGDLAYGDGRFAKAADAYAAAFAADPEATDAALKAASLFADRFGRLLEAAVLWHQVIAHGGPDAATASAEIAQRHQALDQLLTQQMAKSRMWSQDPRELKKSRLDEAFPDNVELQTRIADAYAARGETIALQYLKRSVQLGLTFDDFSRRPGFRRRLAYEPHGPLAEYATDAFGADAVAALEQKAFDEERAEWLRTVNGMFARPGSAASKTSQLASGKTVALLEKFTSVIRWTGDRYVIETTFDDDALNTSDRGMTQGVFHSHTEVPSLTPLKEAHWEPVPWLDDPRARYLVLTFSEPVTQIETVDYHHSGTIDKTTTTHTTTWSHPVLRATTDADPIYYLNQLRLFELSHQAK